MALLAALVIFTVIARYCFSLSWKQLAEFNTTLFAFTTFWGMGINVIKDEHVMIDILYDGVKPARKRWLAIVNYLIVLAVVLGWCASALYRFCTTGARPTWAAILALFAMVSMGVLGFIDDFAKVRKKQNEGLTVGGKFFGQVVFATIFAVLALIVPTRSGFPVAQAGMSFIEKPFLSFEFAGRILSLIHI